MKIMKDPSINIYPNLKEQMFLFNKTTYEAFPAFVLF